MQQRDREILEHMIRYCDRVASYLEKLGNSRERIRSILTGPQRSGTGNENRPEQRPVL